MENLRKRSRRKFSQGEQIEVKIMNNNRNIIGSICDITSQGLGVKIDYNSLVQIKDKICCSISLDKKKPIFFEAIVTNIFQIDSKTKKIGLKYIYNRKSNERKFTRFKAPKHLQPIASLRHPFMFNDIIWMNIQHFSRHGIDCITSSRNNHLIPGMQFKLQVFLPVLGNCNLEVEVNYVFPSTDTQDEIKVGLIFIDLDIDSSGKICEFLVMTNTDLSFKKLKEEGFETTYTSSAVDFDIVSEESDFQEICKLRLEALQSQNRFLDIDDASQMRDSYDEHSLICAARIGKKIIGSARITYNNGIKAKCEHYNEYNVDLPDWLWKEGFVEVGRVVTNPEFRGGDLFKNITQWLGRQTMMSGYKYMLSSCEKKLVHIYKSSGCKVLKSFKSEDGEEWYLLLLNVPGTSKTQNINPILWNILYKPTFEYVKKRNKLQLNFLDRLRISLYLLFAPLATTLYKKQILKRKPKQK